MIHDGHLYADRARRDRREMKFTILIVVLGLAASCAAEAQLELDPPGDLELDEPMQLTLRDEPGMWFPMEKAREMLADLRELVPLRAAHDLAEQELALYETRVGITDEINENYRTALERSDALFEAQRDRAREAEERADRWTRSPILWFTVGVLAAGAVVALTAYALNATGDPP